MKARVDSREETSQDGKKLKSPHFWVTSTYFAEGFPYTIVNTLAELVFKDRGASLEAIGLTSIFHLPWNLKFIWGPLLDRYGTKRKWLLGTELLLTIVILFLTFMTEMQTALIALAIMFIVLAFLSATHDIAIDGFYLEGLSKGDQAKFVGYRATAYKIASLVITGPLVIFIGKTSWAWGLAIATLIMVILLAYHWYALPRMEVQQLGFKDFFKNIKAVKAPWMFVTLCATALVVRYWDVISSIDLSTVIIGFFFGSIFISALLISRVKGILQKSKSAFATAYLNF